MGKKKVEQERSHFIFHLFLLLIITGQSFSFSSIKNAKTSEEMTWGNSHEILLEEGAEITDAEIKNQIRMIVDEIYAKDRNFLDGVERILVSREDLDYLSNSSACDGHLLGAFSDGTILLKESGEQTNRRTLYHEVGHNLWQKLGRERREEWKTLFFASESFVSVYAGVSAEEDFAESFSCLMIGSDRCAPLAEGKREFLNGILN